MSILVLQTNSPTMQVRILWPSHFLQMLTYSISARSRSHSNLLSWWLSWNDIINRPSKNSMSSAVRPLTLMTNSPYRWESKPLTTLLALMAFCRGYSFMERYLAFVWPAISRCCRKSPVPPHYATPWQQSPSHFRSTKYAMHFEFKTVLMFPTFIQPQLEALCMFIDQKLKTPERVHSLSFTLPTKTLKFSYHRLPGLQSFPWRSSSDFWASPTMIPLLKCPLKLFQQREETPFRTYSIPPLSPTLQLLCHPMN